MCRYAQFYAFISVIELPRIPAYCPKYKKVWESLGKSEKKIKKIKTPVEYSTDALTNTIDFSFVTKKDHLRFYSK